MKIAMIGQKGIPATYGGIERHVEELSARLAAMGHEVSVYCRPHYTEKDGTHRGVRLVKTGSINTKHLDAITHTLGSTLHAALRGNDICHYHALGPSVFSGVPRLFGARTVSTIHGLDWQRDKWGGFATRFLKFGEWCSATFPNRTIVVSKTLKKYYDTKYNMDSAYIPNGVQVPVSRPASIIRDKFGLGGRDYLLFVGRLVPEKGCHTLIDAFKRLDTDMKLVIAGGSSHSDSYEEDLKARGAKDPRVVFTGYVYGETLEELYSNCYLYVQPSLIEGLPIALLEALSYGNAGLVSDIPENVEVIEHPDGGTPYGFTFKCNDEDDLSAAMGRLIAGPGLVAETAARVAEHIRAGYDWDDIARDTLKVYEKAIGG